MIAYNHPSNDNSVQEYRDDFIDFVHDSSYITPTRCSVWMAVFLCFSFL